MFVSRGDREALLLTTAPVLGGSEVLGPRYTGSPGGLIAQPCLLHQQMSVKHMHTKFILLFLQFLKNIIPCLCLSFMKGIIEKT